MALDRGLVRWAEVIAALRSVGYRGWLSLEDFSTRPFDGIELSRIVALAEQLAKHLPAVGKA